MWKERWDGGEGYLLLLVLVSFVSVLYLISVSVFALTLTYSTNTTWFYEVAVATNTHVACGSDRDTDTISISHAGTGPVSKTDRTKTWIWMECWKATELTRLLHQRTCDKWANFFSVNCPAYPSFNYIMQKQAKCLKLNANAVTSFQTQQMKSPGSSFACMSPLVGLMLTYVEWLQFDCGLCCDVVCDWKERWYGGKRLLVGFVSVLYLISVCADVSSSTSIALTLTRSTNMTWPELLFTYALPLSMCMYVLFALSEMEVGRRRRKIEIEVGGG